MKSIIALLLILLVPIYSVAGTWTTNNYLYKPSQGEYGTAGKQAFDSGLDKVDAKLARTLVVGDPGYLTLSASIAALNVSGVETVLTVPRGSHSITDNTTVNSNIALRVDKGATITIATTKTLTINGDFQAGLYRVFSLTGTGAVTGLKTAYPEWFGAVGNGSTNDAVALQNCMNSSKTTFLSEKTYKFSAPLYPPASHTITSHSSLAVLYNSVYNTAGLYPYNYVTMRNFTLRGTSNVYAGGADGIVILYYNGSAWVDPGGVTTRDHSDMTKWRGAHLTVDNLVIENWSANGMGAGPWSVIENVTIQNNLNEGMLLVGNYTKVINPTISGVKGWGIDIGASYVSVLGGHLYNCGDETSWPADMGGIIINSGTQTAGSTSNKVVGTTIDTSSGWGVLVYAPSGSDYPLTDTILDSLTIKNVNVDNSDANAGAIGVSDLTTSGTKLSRVNISNVVVDTVTVGHGIKVWGARNVNIDNYHVESVPGAGLHFYNGTGAWQGINVGRGTIKAFGTHGIYIYGGSKLNISDCNIGGSTAVSAYYGIRLEGVTKFNITQGVIDLDVTNGYGVFLTGATGHGQVSGVNIANCLSGIYYNGTGDYIKILGNDLSGTVTTPLYRGGTKTAVVQAHNLGVPVPEHADNAAAVLAGLPVKEFYRITGTDHLGVVH
jgi:hypothetical protein